MERSNFWYQQTAASALSQHNTNIETGLSANEATTRLERVGPNVLHGDTRRSASKILIAQLSDFLVLVLVVAAIVSAFIGDATDTIAILAIVILNALLGFTQEYRAEKAMAALKALTSPHARIKRHGQIMLIPAVEVVPGDIVLLEAGNIVPADLRLIEAHQVSIDESMLTGESLAVDKHHLPLPQGQIAISEQKNMAFKGTIVASGRAVGVAVHTGMSTEMGRIATLLKQEVDIKTPLQNRIARFAKNLALIIAGLCVVVFIVGLLRGEDPLLMFMTALSLAVAGIPEALPAVVTVALALGARAMSKKNALIRKLSAVEALGSVTTICSDKTGTLTENRMRLQQYYLEDQFHETAPHKTNQAWELALKILALNNDVTLNSKNEIQGDPTETALVDAALFSGIDLDEIKKQYPRLAELPFTSERGMMSTIHRTEKHDLVLTKGAPESVFKKCRHYWGKDGLKTFCAEDHSTTLEHMAQKGLRVLAIAYRNLEQPAENTDLKNLEQSLTLLGFVGLQDPPRPEAKKAVQECQSAGIRVVMITGDHPKTASAIAHELGLTTSAQDKTITGHDLRHMSDTELQLAITQVAVFARVTPEQKIRIVKALQASGEIVAMTGDGVNDAPTLRRADVGLAMGKGGTDVAREASDIILVDDNFATIVAAVREGRRIYDNIRKFIRFALSGNSGEIWTLFLAPFAGLPTPLLPIQILWVNLVTDGLPGLALAFEPEEKNILQRKPRAPKESIFAHGLWQHSIWVGILTALLTLGALAWSYHTGNAHWQTMAFTVLTLTQMGHVLAIRSEKESLFQLGLFTNWPLLGAVVLTFILQLATLYVPALNKIFKTQPLSLQELLICLVISSGVFVAVEIEKWLKRRKQALRS